MIQCCDKNYLIHTKQITLFFSVYHIAAMVVVFATGSYLLLLLMIGLPQFATNEFTLLAVHDHVTKNQASPGLAAAGHYMRDLQQFSFHFSHLIVNEDVNSTLEKIFHELSASNLAEKPTVAIIDTTQSGLAVSAINSIQEKINIPIIFSSLIGNFKTEKNQLHVLPPNQILSTLLRDFILSHQLSLTSVIIQDDYFAFLNLTNCTTYQLPMDKNTIENKLISIHSFDAGSFMLIGSFSFINMILKVASARTIFEASSTVYAFSPEKLTHLKKSCNSSHSLHILDGKLYNKTILDELQLKYSELTTSPQIATLFYFHIGVASLLATSNFIKNSRINKFMGLKNMSTNASHDLLQLVKEKIIKLSSPYGPFYLKNSKIQQDFPIEVTQLINDQCEKNQFPNEIKQSALDAALEKSTTGYVIVVAEFPPFIYDDTSSQQKRFYGYCIDLLKELSVHLQFNYTLYESTFGQLPEIDKNHTWTGLYKELIDKKADFALAPMSVMEERQNVVDFTIPIYDTVGISILLRRPSTTSSVFQFVTILENNVWGCILAAYFLTSLILCLFDRLSPYSHRNSKKKYVKSDNDDHEFTLRESLWFCIISLTPLGGVEAPKSVSGKVMVATWWLFGFIVVASYSANLAAYLTVSRHDKTINSLDDLFLQHKIKYAPVNGSVSMAYFERMAFIERKFHNFWAELAAADIDEEERARYAVWEYPVSNKYTKLWQNMKNTKLPRTFEEGLLKVRNEDFALLAEGTELKYETMINCDVMIAGDEFSRKPYAIAVQKGSPLKRLLSLGILKLEEDRVLENLKNKWWGRNKNNKVCNTINVGGGGISLKNNGGVFCVVLIGIGLAGLTLLFEYWWCKYRKSRIKDTTCKVSVTKVKSQPNRRVKYRSPTLRKHLNIRPRLIRSSSGFSYYYQN